MGIGHNSSETTEVFGFVLDTFQGSLNRYQTVKTTSLKTKKSKRRKKESLTHPKQKRLAQSDLSIIIFC